MCLVLTLFFGYFYLFEFEFKKTTVFHFDSQIILFWFSGKKQKKQSNKNKRQIHTCIRSQNDIMALKWSTVCSKTAFVQKLSMCSKWMDRSEWWQQFSYFFCQNPRTQIAWSTGVTILLISYQQWKTKLWLHTRSANILQNERCELTLPSIQQFQSIVRATRYEVKQETRRKISERKHDFVECTSFF